MSRSDLLLLRPAVALGLCLILSACKDGLDSVRSLANEAPLLPAGATRQVVDGVPERGRFLLTSHACTTCHALPGEAQPAAHVGPPLTQFGRRTNIGGSLPNEPEILVRFIMNAPRVLPGTAMPDLSVNEADARHIAALLYTLR